MLSFIQFIEEKFNPTAETQKAEQKRNAEIEKHNHKFVSDVLTGIHKRNVKMKKDQLKRQIEDKKHSKDPEGYYKKQAKKKYNEIKRKLRLSK